MLMQDDSQAQSNQILAEKHCDMKYVLVLVARGLPKAEGLF